MNNENFKKENIKMYFGILYVIKVQKYIGIRYIKINYIELGKFMYLNYFLS